MLYVIMRSLLYLILGILTALISLAGIAILENTAGLHTLFLVGDVELLAVSLVVGFIVVGLSYKFQRRALDLHDDWYVRAFKNSILLYLGMLALIVGLTNVETGSLQSAYIGTFVAGFGAVAVANVFYSYLFRMM
jgi:hypothetical protein